MNRSLIIHAGLLLVALGAAYATWTAGKPSKVEKPTLVELEPDALERVVYTWPAGRTELALQGRGEAREVVVRLEHEEKKPRQLKPRPAAVEDGGVAEDGGAAPEPPAPRLKSEFPAGASVLQALDKLAPLTALRELGSWEPARLEKMGLAEPERSLEVQAGARSYTLDIGAKTYGAQGHYARLRGKDAVYLVPTALVSGFEGNPSRLMEWRLLPTDPEDIVSLQLRQGTTLQKLIQVDREQPSKRYFALASAPDQKSEEGAALVNRLRGLRASTYLADAPDPAGLNEVASFAVEPAKGAAVELTLFERRDGSGYLARTGRWLAEVNEAQAGGLIEDLGALFAE